MKNGVRKAGIATAMLAAAGAMVTVGTEVASAQAPPTHGGSGGTGAHATQANSTQANSTQANSTQAKSTQAKSTQSTPTHVRNTAAKNTASHATSASTQSANTGSTHSASTRNASTHNASVNNASVNNASVNNASADIGATGASQRETSSQAKSAQGGSAQAASAKALEGSAKGKAALQYAKKQLGKPYSFAAAGPGSFDCSGLTMQAWKQAGVSLPHSAHKQFNQGPKVSQKDLQAGDLVFFYGPNPHHVGVYAGNGKVIDAPRPGTNVRVDTIKSMPVAGATRPA